MAFRDAGLVALLEEHGLQVDDHGDLPTVRWTPDRVSPHAQHAAQVASVANGVATAVAGAFAANDAVLVLGGDCTIEVGVVSALSTVDERVGLVYLDAGPDLNVPASVRMGFLDWMGSAHLLGLPGATEALSHIGPRFPLLRPDQLVFLGAVPEELTEWENGVIADKDLRVIWCDEVREDPARAARTALAALDRHVDRIVVHFDVDVIDFPAADCPTINAGLTLAEALACVEACAHHPKFAALTICEFNPDHVDEQRQLVRQFVEGLVSALPSG
jgi:arginase